MKTSPIQLIIMIFFGMMAMGALGVLSGVITLPKSAEENISGQVVAWGTLDPKAFQFVENQIKLANKNISFQYVQKSLINFETQLNEAIASGRGPDIIILSQEQILQNQAKIAVQNLSADSRIAFRETYMNGAHMFLSEDGLIAYPIAVDPLVMYYNDRLMTSAGFSRPPQFWDEIGSYVEKLTVRNDNRDIRGATMAMGTFNNVVYGLDIISALILQTGTPIVDRQITYTTTNTPITSYRAVVDTPQTPQVIEFFNAFADPNKNLYSWNTSLPRDIDAFSSEFLVFWFGYPTDEATIRAKNPNLVYKIAPIPQIRNSRVRLTYGKIYGAAVLRSSPNIQAAFIAQRTLAQGTPLQFLVEDANLQYPFRSIPASATNTENKAFFAQQAVQVIGYFTPSVSFTYNLFRDTLGQVAAGSLRAADGAKRLESELNNFILRNQL